MNLSAAYWTPAWLWLAVIASGLYHGVNPGMGWPLAVSAGLMERSPRALVAALWPLTAGHLLAMLLVILPFALLVAVVEWQRTIQIGASLLVIAFGLYRLANRRHPRALARISPAQFGLWSFAVALAHGAALMLVPIYLWLCREAELDRGHQAAGTLINANLGMAVLVATVHAATMIAAGGCCAWLAYRYLGLKFISQSWFNLDTTWAGKRVNEDPAPPTLPGEATSIEVLAQKLVLFVGNPASDALAFWAALDRQFRMWVRIDGRCGGALHKTVW